MGVALVVCFKEKGSQNVLEGIIRITLTATSMEESLLLLSCALILK